MKNGDRQEYVTNFLKIEVLPILFKKGAEYATEDGDVNGNFKQTAKETDLTTLQVWNSHFSKHLDAVRNYVRQDAIGDEIVMAEPIEGRIVDAINYLLILRSLIHEQRIERARQIGTKATHDEVSGG